MSDRELVIMMTVDGGEVIEVYRLANEGESPDKTIPVKMAETVDLVKEKDNLNSALMMPLERVDHFWASSSPGCRYVKVGGVWKRVCT